MKEFLYIAKAVADETRARILMLLRNGELCVCQLVDVLELAPSTVSKHMAILTQAGLVEVRKHGRWRYYRLICQKAPPSACHALDWVHASLGDSSLTRKDAKRLKATLKKDIQAVCDRYKG